MEDDLPREIGRGTFNLFGVDVVVINLDNGQRLIEAESMEALFEAMSLSGEVIDHDEAIAFAQAVRGA